MSREDPGTDILVTKGSHMCILEGVEGITAKTMDGGEVCWERV